MNKHGGKNPNILNEHASKCANIVELKSIFINKHVLLLDRWEYRVTVYKTGAAKSDTRVK